MQCLSHLKYLNNIGGLKRQILSPPIHALVTGHGRVQLEALHDLQQLIQVEMRDRFPGGHGQHLLRRGWRRGRGRRRRQRQRRLTLLGLGIRRRGATGFAPGGGARRHQAVVAAAEAGSVGQRHRHDSAARQSHLHPRKRRGLLLLLLLLLLSSVQVMSGRRIRGRPFA